MNIQQFLDRIQFDGKIDVSLECLSILQEKFIRNIPFENTYIIKKIPLDYSYSAVFKKIVTQRRGGVCYENNSLFFWALSELGFNVQYIEAEMFPAEKLRGKFDHMALLVSFGAEQYLVDVGNGKYFGFPIKINSSHESIAEGIKYRVQKHHDKFLALCFFEDEQWKYRYAFSTTEKTLDDFKKACEFTQTSPDSAFTKDVLITRLNSNYRATLSGTSLTKTYFDGSKSKHEISEVKLEEALLFEFGLEK